MLTAEYTAPQQKPTYTYTNLLIEPVKTFIHGVLNRQFKGKESKLSVILVNGKKTSLTAFKKIYPEEIFGDVVNID